MGTNKIGTLTQSIRTHIMEGLEVVIPDDMNIAQMIDYLIKQTKTKPTMRAFVYGYWLDCSCEKVMAVIAESKNQADTLIKEYIDNEVEELIAQMNLEPEDIFAGDYKPVFHGEYDLKVPGVMVMKGCIC